MSNYILTLPLETEKWQEDKLNKKFEECRRVYNSCLTELYKRYNCMKDSKAYQNNCKYKGKDRNKIFTELNIKYGLTKYSFYSFIKPMAKYYNISSMVLEKLAFRAVNAFQKYMFHKAKKINYKSFGELKSIEAKSNKQAIRYRNGKLIFCKMQMSIKIKKSDIYAHMSLENTIKYCRIKREMIKGRYHYYVQFILDGTPPVKITNRGELKGRLGEGKVGIDIGTRTIAYSSKYEAGLKELAPEANSIEKELRVIERAMDRSRRSTNSNKYNDNGTNKKGNKDKWIKSNNYLKLQTKRKELFRKQKEIRKQSHCRLSNYLLSLGDEFYVENMNYSGLKKKAKKTTKNKNGKFNKKKRFGKSVGSKAPAMFLTILDNKLRWNNTQLYKIDTVKIKASQYNHFTDKYKKKKLSERWNDFEGFKIQRDLYSSFLIMCVKDNLKEIDRELCFKEFDNFKILHDKEIKRIKLSDNKIISSMSI